MLDRFDLFTEMTPIEFDELHTTIASESSEEIYKRVYSAIEIQKERFKKEDFCYNALIPAKYISKYCHLGKTESDFIRTAFEKFSFSLRSYHKVLRVARTIADLDQEDSISIVHLSEAVSFRKALLKYWG